MHEYDCKERNFQRIYAKRDISGKYLDGKSRILLKKITTIVFCWSNAHTNDKINDKKLQTKLIKRLRQMKIQRLAAALASGFPFHSELLVQLSRLLAC